MKILKILFKASTLTFAALFVITIVDYTIGYGLFVRWFTWNVFGTVDATAAMFVLAAIFGFGFVSVAAESVDLENSRTLSKLYFGSGWRRVGSLIGAFFVSYLLLSYVHSVKETACTKTVSGDDSLCREFVPVVVTYSINDKYADVIDECELNESVKGECDIEDGKLKLTIGGCKKDCSGVPFGEDVYSVPVSLRGDEANVTVNVPLFLDIEENIIR